MPRRRCLAPAQTKRERHLLTTRGQNPQQSLLLNRQPSEAIEADRAEPDLRRLLEQIRRKLKQLMIVFDIFSLQPFSIRLHQKGQIAKLIREAILGTHLSAKLSQPRPADATLLQFHQQPAELFRKSRRTRARAKNP